MDGRLPLLDRAAWIAAAAHREQVRKIDGAPYVAHPVNVALLLARYGFGETVLAAALVHDVLEDTAYPEPQLRSELGDEVTDVVLELTEDKSKTWEERKAWAVSSVASKSPAARAIALADRIHNVRGLIAGHAQFGAAVWDRLNRGRDPQLAYLERLLLAHRQAWQHPLVDEYAAALTELAALG